MDRIVIDFNDEELEVEVIRYFEKNNGKYLIYSLNEIDNEGYVKLYCTKVYNHSAVNVTSDEEWIMIKEMIKEIVKDNRDGSNLNVEDLNYNEINNISVEGNRVFKLQGNLVNLLSANKKEFKIIEDTFDEIIEEDDDYKYQELERRIVLLEQELELYKDKFERIKEIIEQD